MPSLDEIFYKEFKNSMQIRRGTTPFNMNIPMEKSITTPIPTRNKAIIRGIGEEYYTQLNYTLANKEVVTLIGRQKLKKKVFMPDGRRRMDENNQPKMEDVTVPTGLAGVISSIKIGVPKAYESNEGLSYVDFIKQKEGKTGYIYLIPKKYLYQVNLCALVMSYNKLRSYYTMVSVNLVNGHSIHLSVIPFKPTYTRDNKPYKIIAVKPNANFDTEICRLLEYWEGVGVMFGRQLTQLSEPINGVLNCGVFHYVSTLDNYELYDREKSLEGVEEYY